MRDSTPNEAMSPAADAVDPIGPIRHSGVFTRKVVGGAVSLESQDILAVRRMCSVGRFSAEIAPEMGRRTHYTDRTMNTCLIRTAQKACGGRATDCQLLARFVDHNDGDAFAELVSRYGGLVLGLCRRTLRDDHSAEDAFQATFLVLARRAARIHNRSSLAGWLYAVAHRTALRAKIKRRRLREVILLDEMTDSEDTLAEVTRRHEQRLLDEELHQLADKYREPLVRRHLMGRSNKQIAAELGLSVGVVEGRLKRGKNLLRFRLARRGVSLAAGLATVGVSVGAARAADALITATVDAAVAYRAGTPIQGHYSQDAIRLAQQELAMKSSTLVTTMSCAAIAIAVAGFTLAGAGEAGQQTPQPTSTVVVVPPVPAPAQDDPLRLARDENAAPVSGPRDFRSPLEEEIDKTLREPTTIDFVETPLQDVADFIADAHKLHVLIDYRALDDVGIQADTPVTFHLEGVSLNSSLNAMLRPLDLTWTVHDDVLWITTPEANESMLVVRLYEVTDLTACQDKSGEMWADYDTLIEMITSTIQPDSWGEVGGVGAIQAAPLGGAEMLAIRQTYQVHCQIDQLLKQVRAIVDKKGADQLPVREPDTGGMLGGGGMGGMLGVGGEAVGGPGRGGGPPLFGSAGGVGTSAAGGTPVTDPFGPTPLSGSAVTPDRTAGQIRVYDLGNVAEQTAKEALRAVAPQAVILRGDDPKKLIVFARPDEHERVSKSLQAIQSGNGTKQ